MSYWALDISVRMVYYHQLSVMFVRVWRCFIRIVRLYLSYCILALSILFCYGICDSLFYIISVYFVSLVGNVGDMLWSRRHVNRAALRAVVLCVCLLHLCRERVL